MPPDVRLLVTSRERLNLREEWIFDVGGMSYPKNGRDSNKVYSGLHLFKNVLSKSMTSLCSPARWSRMRCASANLWMVHLWASNCQQAG